jgi:hypothetical protein
MRRRCGLFLHAPSSFPQFDRNVAVREAAHATVSRLLGLSVAGSTIDFIDGHFGSTWTTCAALDPDAESVDDLVAGLMPLMPPLFDDRSDVAVELERTSCQVISLLAGPEAERLFCAAPLPGSEHDRVEAFMIAGLIVRSPRSVDASLEFAEAEAPRPTSQ